MSDSAKDTGPILNKRNPLTAVFVAAALTASMGAGGTALVWAKSLSDRVLILEQSTKELPGRVRAVEDANRALDKEQDRVSFRLNGIDEKLDTILEAIEARPVTRKAPSR